ncbi:MAG: hypothetical protein ACR2H5_00835 [Ktedonobacteraceae bacterium]
MNITPAEAQSTLDDIQHTQTLTRKVRTSWAWCLVVCGAYWTVGFLLTQFQPQPIYPTWSEFIVIGMASSAIYGRRQEKHVRLTPGSRATFINSRLGISFVVLYGFFMLWQILFPLTPLQIAMFWITVVMFGYIIVGVWLQQPLSMGFGAGVTLMSVLGYFLLPHYFWLWVAVFAGLPLVGMGIYYLRRG